MHRASRAAGVIGLALATAALAAAPAGARPRAFVAVNQIQALPAHAHAGQAFRLHGIASNRGARAARGRITLRLLRRGHTQRVVGRVSLRLRAHATRRFTATVRVPALNKGSYQLAACAPRGIGGMSTCAAGARELQVAGGDPVRGAVAAKQAAPAVAADGACSSGPRTLAPPHDHIYPEGGNGGYKSVHTATHLVYDAPSNTFLAGTYVDQTVRATQCLTDLSFDFERHNDYVDPDHPAVTGPNMTVSAVEVNGQPAAFTFVQPTYPGDPNGQDDPDPAAHAASNTDPVSATNPNPPACAPASDDPAAVGAPCPANKLVVTPAAPVAAGQTLTVRIEYAGSPGVHEDGDGSAEGWFRNGTDGSFVTTEPMGTEDWLPLNNHPTAKPTYDFTTITNPDRTAISNGILVSSITTPADPAFKDPATGAPRDSITWTWHSPEPVQNYLVENSVGTYDNGYQADPGLDPHTGAKVIDGILYYEFQAHSGIPTGPRAPTPAQNKAVMDQQSDITRFQSTFNGPFPFSSDGVIVGVPDAGFEEEMQTKITFANGSIGVGVLHHENMHQWWGDNVAESLFRYTFLKEGMATVGEALATARSAGKAAGAEGSAAYQAAFDASLVSQFNSTYAWGTTNRTRNNWVEVPSDPSPATLFDNPPTYARPGASYIALRQILGDARWRALLQRIQRELGGGNISEAQMEAYYQGALPNQSPACHTKLGQFFTQWWDTGYAPGGGANRPQITGPGLAGPGFYDASGPCSSQTTPLTTASFANGHLTLTATDDGKGAGQTFYSLDGGPFQPYTAPVPVVAGGTHTVVFYSTDAQGNQEPNETYTFTLSVDGTGTVTGSVPATLMLTLGAPATFAGFTPGVTKDYSATTMATVTSTAADAALSVSDPSTTAPGHLVNGPFVMPSALQASAASPAAGAGPAPASLGASPLTVLRWTAPASNDAALVTFTQHIDRTDALRTGTYSKTLTFTLSTTTP